MMVELIIFFSLVIVLGFLMIIIGAAENPLLFFFGFLVAIGGMLLLVATCNEHPQTKSKTIEILIIHNGDTTKQVIDSTK